jgi:plastocyanin
MKQAFTSFSGSLRLFIAALALLAYSQAYAVTTHTVTVQNYSFTPDTVNAVIGDTIRWVWVSGSHTTTSTGVPSGALAWDAPMNGVTATYSYVVAVAGTYNYHCSMHPTLMTGIINVSATNGIATVESRPLRVYPQPFRNELNISWGNEIVKKNVTVQVFDLLGQTRYEATYPEINADIENIDLSDLNTGIYLVTISTPGTRQTFKVSKL